MPDVTELLEWLVKGLCGLLGFYVLVRIGSMAVLKSYAEYRKSLPEPDAAKTREY